MAQSCIIGTPLHLGGAAAIAPSPTSARRGLCRRPAPPSRSVRCMAETKTETKGPVSSFLSKLFGSKPVESNPGPTQAELEEARAAMRKWWLDQLEEKAKAEAAAAAAVPAVSQAELDKGRAEMREWWREQLDSKTPKPAAPEAASPAATKAQAPKVVLDPEEAAIQAALKRDKEEYLERVRIQTELKQKPLDRAREHMRKWWLQQQELKKRGRGEKPYGPVLKLVSSEYGTIDITGDHFQAILVGAGPFESVDGRTFTIDVPEVSGKHALVYAKDVAKGRLDLVTGLPQYERSYFVRDLGSTNGTFFKTSKLRPNVEVSLKAGETVAFGKESIKFEVTK